MKVYYLENREACIKRAKEWAQKNPRRKQEINRSSNLRLHGTAHVRHIEPSDCREAWDRFLWAYRKADSDADKKLLCEDFLDTPSSKVITIPTEIEDILTEHVG